VLPRALRVHAFVCGVGDACDVRDTRASDASLFDDREAQRS
jgi:hypothetical protein